MDLSFVLKGEMMKVRILSGLLLSLISLSLLAKTPNPLCAGVTGSSFTSGNGTLANPYLICNTLQFASIGASPTLLNQNFVLGANLSFLGKSFVMIGSQSTPFQGTFDGNGYTLSSISLSSNSDYLAIFPSTNNATIKNLLLNSINIGGQPFQYVAGLIAYANGTTITNVRITNLKMSFAAIYSGGLVGQATYSTISNVSVQGTMQHFFGTKHSGGLVGEANYSHISSCASHVNAILFTPTDFGIDAVGLLVGELLDSTIINSYADGNFDYSIAQPAGLNGHLLGGLIGETGGSVITNSYYAGKIIVKYVDNVGGAVGYNYGGTTTSSGLFWDTTVSGLTTSALGSGEPTCLMQQSFFWLAKGYDPTIWVLADGVYPKLVSEN